MPRFPTREADIAALAGTMVYGLTEFPENFPSCPVPVEDLQQALDRYTRAKESAATAQGAAAAAFAEKEEAMGELTEKMKDVLRHAERAAREDESMLKNIGWSARKEPGTLELPGAPRTLEVKREGRGWVYLDWKTPADGGAVAAYRVMRRVRGESEWVEAGLCFESMTVLTDQQQNVELEYQVIAVNKAGDSLPSNLITVAL
jgi:hypothetical protein